MNIFKSTLLPDKMIKLDIYMLHPEWIRQPKWIKIFKIIFFKMNMKEYVLICFPNIFAIHILGVKYCFHP